MYEDLILSINTSSSVGKVAFRLARNAKGADFPNGNCTIAWDRLVSEYTLHTALSLLKLKSNLHKIKLESIKKDPDELISNLEGLRIQMNEFCLNGSVTDKDFMIHSLNNSPKQYDVICNGLENCLTVSGDNTLTIEIICKKLNHWYEKIKSKNEERREKKRF